MKKMVQAVIALSVIASASVSLAQPKCSHRDGSGITAKTNPEIRVAKSGQPNAPSASKKAVK